MKKALLTVAIATLLPVNSYAQTHYPEEFAEFFTEDKQTISVVFAGEYRGEDITAMVSYDTFRIEKDSASLQRFRRFLERQELKAEAVEQILADAVTGIQTDAQCNDTKQRCTLAPASGEVKYVFDFDDSQLKLFVAPDVLNHDIAEVEYESAYSAHNAIINWSDLYAYTNIDGSENLSWNNLTTVGLPLGHMTFDTQYESQSGDFDVFSALYDVDYENYHAQIGLNEYNVDFNSTNYLSNGSNLAGKGVHFGTSKQLMKGKQASLQRIYFYAPQSGQLEIYRNDKLILDKVVNEGKQYISYDELPKGAYDITLMLKAAGNTILTERRQIVNNQQFSLMNGELDFLLSIGELEDLELTETDYQHYDREYLRGAVNYRLYENAMLGASLTLDRNDQYGQMGINYLSANQLGIEAVGGIFSSGEQFVNTRLSMAPFFIDFEHFDLNDATESNSLYPHYQEQHFNLAKQMYGTRSYQEVGVGISGRVFGGSGYLRFDQFDYSYAMNSLSGGWSRAWLGGNVSINVDYTESDEMGSEFKTSLTWTKEFGKGISTQVTIDTDQDGFNNNTNYLRGEWQQDNWFANGAIGATINKNNQINGDLSGTLSGHQEHFNVSGYGYVNDSGQRNFSGSISGTQVISPKGIEFNHEKSRAFVQMNTQYQDESLSQDIEEIKLYVSEGEQYKGRHNLDEQLIAVDEYAQLKLELDDSTTSLHVQSEPLQTFVHPGALYQLDSTIMRQSSQVVVLDDIYNTPITHAQCIGDGCVRVEPLSSDGVFRVTYLEGSDFRLISRKGLCVYEENADIDYSQGYCLPGLESAEDNQRWENSSALLNDVDQSELLIYLGQFHSEGESENIVSRLKTLNVEHKTFSVGTSVYIYIVGGQSLTTAQRQLLESLDAYVLLKNSEIDLLTFTAKEHPHSV